MNLFDPDETPQGFTLTPLWLSQSEQSQLLTEIESNIWSTDLGRRTQHYGHRYDYRSGRVDNSVAAPQLPPLIQQLADRLYEEGWFKQLPDQCIVNEYVVGGDVVQGISPHRDHVTDFGSVIVTLSLLESWSMRFTRLGHEPFEFTLDPGSIAVLSGDARYEWEHSIPARKYDRNGGMRVPRQRRVSVTFRTVGP